MGLDCLPVPCKCPAHEQVTIDAPEGMTHPTDTVCPFQSDNFPKGPVFAGCCWLRGKVAERELEALGEEDLSLRMREDMTHRQAIDFAAELREVADRLEAKVADTGNKPKGAGWNGRWNERKKDWVWQEYSTFDEAIAAVREAARWYEKVGSLGFGVHAWY